MLVNPSLLLLFAASALATQSMRRPANYKDAPNIVETETDPTVHRVQKRQSGGKNSFAYFTNWGVYGANFRAYRVLSRASCIS